MQIPKVIHYCWFGGNQLPKLAEKCIESWRKYCPDYEIVQWNESNFDLNSCDYVRQAYAEKKYAFVSDYARLKILYDNGGVYLDTDVELLKRLPDKILENGYLAKETDCLIATGLGFACKKGDDFIGDLLKKYESEQFVKLQKSSGDFNYKTCVEQMSELLEENNITIDINTENIFGIPVYPDEFFCGFDVTNNCYNITENTISVHHYSGSWVDNKHKLKNKIKRLISRIIGKNGYSKLRQIKRYIKR